MESITKKQKIEDIQHDQPISLVWLDNSVEESEENVAAQPHLRALDTNLKLFKNDKECEDYIKSQTKHIVLIVNGKLGKELIPRVHTFPQILSIYVYCGNKPLHEKWAKDFTKIRVVIDQFNELKNRIRMDHFNQELQTFIEILMSNTIRTRLIDEFDHLYIISDVNMDYLSRMKPTSNEKDEFIGLCQSKFEGDSQRLALLQEFQESYSPNQAVTWFRRDPFFYQIIENAFKSVETETMYLCRVFIRDIQKQFEELKCTTSIQVYRCQLLADNEFEQLKNSESKIIAIKSFFCTTLDREKALDLVPGQNDCKRVLFEIEANPELQGVKPFVKTNALGDQSNEHAVLFMLGSLFKINQICDEVDGIIIIKMTLCANDNEFKNRCNDINEDKDFIGFVQLQYDMSQSLSQPEVLDTVDQLIKKYLNELSDDHPDRTRCYDILGNMNFVKSNFDGSLSWYEKSHEMKKRILQSNDPNLAESYKNIALVHLQKGEGTQALQSFQHLLMIWKQIYGDDHVYLIWCYSYMINIYEADGKYREVLLCYHHICAIMLKDHSIDDGKFASIYNNIAKTYANLNQYGLALGYYTKSLEIKLKTLPPTDGSIALTYKSIGIIYECMNNADQARIHFEQAADIYRQLYPSTHENVLEIEEFIKNVTSSV